MQIEIRPLFQTEITPALFAAFDRRQTVTACRRRIRGVWQTVDDPFVDDWTPQEIEELCCSLQSTVQRGGLVLAALHEENTLLGFVSVEVQPMGTRGQYRDLTHLYVSASARGSGVGKQLFMRACAFAKAHGGEKLYISAHSAIESQAFYAAMGCVDAVEISVRHAQEEPCDCQLERKL